MDDGICSLTYGSNCFFCLNDYPRSDLLRLSEYLNNRIGKLQSEKNARIILLRNEVKQLRFLENLLFL